jgi:hypothetical protein
MIIVHGGRPGIGTESTIFDTTPLVGGGSGGDLPISAGGESLVRLWDIIWLFKRPVRRRVIGLTGLSRLQ